MQKLVSPIVLQTPRKRIGTIKRSCSENESDTEVVLMLMKRVLEAAQKEQHNYDLLNIRNYFSVLKIQLLERIGHQGMLWLRI